MNSDIYYLHKVNNDNSLILRPLIKNKEPDFFNVKLYAVSVPCLSSPSSECLDDPFAWQLKEYLKKKLKSKDLYVILAPYINKNILSEPKQVIIVYRSIVKECFVDISEKLLKKGFAKISSHDLLYVKLKCYAEIFKNPLPIYKNYEYDGRIKTLGIWQQNIKIDCVLYKHIYDDPSFLKGFSLKKTDYPIDYIKEKEKLSISNFVNLHRHKKYLFFVEEVHSSTLLYGRIHIDDKYAYYIEINLTGIQFPDEVNNPDNSPCNRSYYEREAMFFVESRLFVSSIINITIDGYLNNKVYATLKHPNGNISLLMLLNGMVEIDVISISLIPAISEKYINSENNAKLKRIRIWSNLGDDRKNISFNNAPFMFERVKVVEVDNNLNLVVCSKDDKIVDKRLNLAYILTPVYLFQDAIRININNKEVLFSVPCLFYAREELRKLVVGEYIFVRVESRKINAKTNAVTEFVSIYDKNRENIIVKLVLKGLVKVYETKLPNQTIKFLQTYENQAKSNRIGLFAPNFKDFVINVSDFTYTHNKRKHLKMFLLNSGLMEAIVEVVHSGHRYLVYIPEHKCLVNISLNGIKCELFSKEKQTNDEHSLYGYEAYQYAKKKFLQRDVKVEIVKVDRFDNFIANVYLSDGVLIQERLLELGLAKSSENSSSIKGFNIKQIEDLARKNQLGIWSVNNEFENESTFFDRLLVSNMNNLKVKSEDVLYNFSSDKDSQTNFKTKIKPCTFYVTKISEDIYIQGYNYEEEDKLEEFLKSYIQVNNKIVENPIINKTYLFFNKQEAIIKRAKLLDISVTEGTIMLLDYGSIIKTNLAYLRECSVEISERKLLLKICRLASIEIPSDIEKLKMIKNLLNNLILEKDVNLKVLYKNSDDHCYVDIEFQMENKLINLKDFLHELDLIKI